jgi:hypothetical protein
VRVVSDNDDWRIANISYAQGKSLGDSASHGVKNAVLYDHL